MTLWEHRIIILFMHPFSHSSSITTQPSKHSSRSDKEVDATWNAIWQNLLAHTTRRVAVIRYMVSWDTIQTTFCDPRHVTKKTDPDGKLAKSAPHRTLPAFIIISAQCSNKAYPLSYLRPIITTLIFRGANWGHSARVHANISITVSVLHFSQHNISPAPH